MEKLKNKKIGRPKYVEDEELLKKLYIKIKNKELTNTKAWQIMGCGKTKWYELKKKYEKLEAKSNVK